jgi:hypothetical protein
MGWDEPSKLILNMVLVQHSPACLPQASLYFFKFCARPIFGNMEKKIFQVWEFQEFGKAKAGNLFFYFFSFCIFGRPCLKIPPLRGQRQWNSLKFRTLFFI